jgi:prophage regulatory protein
MISTPSLKILYERATEAMTQHLQNTLDQLIGLIAHEIADKCMLEIGKRKADLEAKSNAIPQAATRCANDSNNMLKLNQVQQRVALSRSTIYLMVKEGNFPKPVKIGKRAVAWSEASISRFLAERSR